MAEEKVAVKSVDEKLPSDLEKLSALFNEEIYVRTDYNSIPTSKFKIFDDLIIQYESEGKITQAREKIEEHLSEYPDSITARYLLGIIALRKDEILESNYLGLLLEQFKQFGKWTIIEYITDKILEFGEQRYALKFKSEALEKLKKKDELKKTLEKLAKHDRKNPEVAKKYGLSILEENKEKAIIYLKQAAESFAKLKEYDQLEEIWPIIVTNNYEDIPFFEKIERILLGHREKSRMVGYLYPIFEPYKDFEEWDKVIYLLKKILDYEPFSNKARNELIKAYRSKYQDHSLLNDFLKMSEIGNTRKPIKLCISNFERNIVFDTNNYVLHRSWGVGKITSIHENGEYILVDFKDKLNHKLSIQMAITSLKPLKKEHIWVNYYENTNKMVELFSTKPTEFLKELVTSFENRISTADIKSEVVGKYIKLLDWPKWWNKIKNVIKKEPNFGFNPKKKDELIFREKAISLSEELQEKFLVSTDINKKLNIAFEGLKYSEEAEDAIDSFNHFYYEEEEAEDSFRKIVAFIYLENSSRIQDDEESLPRHLKKKDIKTILNRLTMDELTQYSSRIENIEIKKDFVELIRELHDDYTNFLIKVLYEVPVKINKYAFTILVGEQKFAEINRFYNDIKKQAKENPDVFLWVAKSILTNAWNYEWLEVDRLDLILRVFRLLKPLVKIEPKGTKFKNACQEILFGNENAVILEALEKGDSEYIRKLFALYKEAPFISDLEKDRLLELINKVSPNLDWGVEVEEEDDENDYLTNIPENSILVTRRAYNKKKEEFDQLVNVEMVENSRDIGEAQERGDLRENAEYKAAMEKQVQLQAQIKKLEAELKTAFILDLTNIKNDKVNIGCTVQLKNEELGENVSYSILGAWDANTEKNIISYQSPLAKSLLGKKVGDEAILNFSGSQTKFKVLEINRYSYQDID